MHTTPRASTPGPARPGLLVSALLATLAATTLLLAGCTSNPTQVLVHLDTDIPPTRRARLRVFVTTGASASGDAGEGRELLRGGDAGVFALPATFGIVPQTGQSLAAPVTLTVRADVDPGVTAGEAPYSLTRTVRFAFTSHLTTHVYLFLTAACSRPTVGCTQVTPDRCTVSQYCAEQSRTCGDNGRCVDPTVGVTTTVRDAAVDDGAGTDGGAPPACSAPSTLCGGACVDTATDPAHCGGCATNCTALPGVSPVAIECAAGRCGVAAACLPGRADCDNNPANGCETDLAAASHCGACATACTSAAPLCSARSPGMYACATGCMAPTPTLCGARCVDVMTDAANCGACGAACPSVAGATPICSGGHCSAVCAPGTHLCGAACIPDVGAACAPANPCHTGRQDCVGTAVGCVDVGFRPAGTSCGGSGVCNALGECVACAQGAGCTPSAACRTGSIECGSGAPVCAVTGPAPVGSACGGGGVCDASGACMGCSAGASCAPAMPCRVGQVSCSSGRAVCEATGVAPPGSPCGPGLVCDSVGACVMCPAGAPCALAADPCGAGMIACDTGAARCVPSGASAAACSPCGSGLACDGRGSCSVPSNTSCGTGSDPCVTQTWQCQPATGTSTCVSAPAPPGGTCDDGRACTVGDHCDGSGGCVGTPIAPYYGMQAPYVMAAMACGTTGPGICICNTFYCSEDGSAQPVAGAAGFCGGNGGADCDYNGCTGTACQRNFCRPCTQADCSDCPSECAP